MRMTVLGRDGHVLRPPAARGDDGRVGDCRGVDTERVYRVEERVGTFAPSTTHERHMSNPPQRSAPAGFPNPKLYLLEYDSRFSVFPEFVFYDFRKPLILPGSSNRNLPPTTRLTPPTASLKQTITHLISDPPYFSSDCQTKSMSSCPPDPTQLNPDPRKKALTPNSGTNPLLPPPSLPPTPRHHLNRRARRAADPQALFPRVRRAHDGLRAGARAGAEQ